MGRVMLNSKLKLTVVIDNCVPTGGSPAFLGEHGLSMLIEVAGQKILLYTGKSDALLHNLSLLGVAPSDLDMILISHGHNDHTGGLYHVLAHARKTMPVFIHEEAFKTRFSISNGQRSFAGIPYRQEQLTRLGADWRFVREPTEILPGLWLSGPVPRKNVDEAGDANLIVFNPENGCDCHDEVLDDMALFYKSEKGLIIISGCTHSGLINMIEHGMAVTQCDRLYGWIGGTHLGPATAYQQNETLARLQDFQPAFVAANHCTGFRMMAKLSEAFGERFIPAFVGTQIEF